MQPRVAPVTGRLGLGYRGPYHWPAMLGFLQARAVDGVERVVDGSHVRILGRHGEVVVIHDAPSACVVVEVRGLPALEHANLARRVRQLFHLDADLGPVTAQLGRDPLLAPLIAQQPGLRVPGCWDPFELAMRAVLGQQVTVEAGRQLASTLVRLCAPARGFPTAAEVLAGDLTALGMPAARKRTLLAVARAVVEDATLLRAGGSLEEAVARLREVPGIGDWTAQYIALRALAQPDAFPASDVVLLRVFSALRGRPATPGDLLSAAEAWRPWRGAAAQHLWSAAASVPRAPGAAP